MKTYIFKTFCLTLVILLSSTLSATADNPVTVKLKNGSNITGNFTREEPLSQYTITTDNGSTIICSFSDVEYIDYLSASTHKSKSNLHKGYRGFFDLGGSYVTYSDEWIDESKGAISVITTHGYQFNKNLFVGLGVGYTHIPDFSCGYIPMFTQVRYDFNITGNCNFFAAANVGCSLWTDTTDPYLYVSPTIGLRVKLDKSAVNISLGYELQYHSYDDGYYYDFSITTHTFAFKVGFEF